MLRHGSSPQSTHSNSHEVWNGNETNADEDKEWCVRDEVRGDHERQTADEGHNGSLLFCVDEEAHADRAEQDTPKKQG